MFHEMFAQGQFQHLWAQLTRRCFCLSDLNETLKTCPVESSSYAGIKTVAIEAIHGTLGKADEFDAEFNPLQERSRTRWMRIALEKILGHDLPPVDLLEVDGVYYVRDGHHRISVSRAMGQSYIDAEVIIMHLRRNAFMR